MRAYLHISQGLVFIVCMQGYVFCDFVSFNLCVFVENYLVIFEIKKSPFKGFVNLGLEPLTNIGQQGVMVLPSLILGQEGGWPGPM